MILQLNANHLCSCISRRHLYPGQPRNCIQNNRGTVSRTTAELHSGQPRNCIKDNRGTVSRTTAELYPGQPRNCIQDNRGTVSRTTAELYQGQPRNCIDNKLCPSSYFLYSLPFAYSSSSSSLSSLVGTVFSPVGTFLAGLRMDAVYEPRTVIFNWTI